MTTIEEALTQLGNTSEAVADTLRQSSIKGRQQSPTRCPVANYLREKGFVGVCVSLRYAVSFGAQMVELPPPVCDFVSDFDAGRYISLQGEMR